MSLDPRTPVLVGAGVASQRCENPADALEPFELMAAALENAADDAGSRRLLVLADRVHVPRGFWEYSDPGRLVADRIGARGARTLLSEIGILQQTLIDDACVAIVSGQSEVALVTGGDCKYRSLRARITGVEVKDTVQTGETPGVVQRPDQSLSNPQEAEAGLLLPVTFFSVIENALRPALGLTLERHRDEIAELWAGFSRIAAGNRHAWVREPVPAREIRDPSPRNRMIAFPYTKLHSSQWNVDQAAGLIFCSLEKAEALGLSRDGWIFPLSGAESNRMVTLSERKEIHRTPAPRIAGRHALELAGLGPDDVAHVDLYSCFPAPVRIKAREIGLGPDRPLTVTGGMAFAGGPLNNYVFQAIARMVEILREDPGSKGLVTAVSGFLTKCGFGVWSTEPPRRGFRFEDVSDRVAAATPTRALAAEHEGPATVAAYTVLYLGENPVKGIVICDLPDGRRRVARSDDGALARAMTLEEFCGKKVTLLCDGTFRAAG